MVSLRLPLLLKRATKSSSSGFKSSSSGSKSSSSGSKGSSSGSKGSSSGSKSGSSGAKSGSGSSGWASGSSSRVKSRCYDVDMYEIPCPRQNTKGGTIAGYVVGGICALLFLAVGVCVLVTNVKVWRRRRRGGDEEKAETEGAEMAKESGEEEGERGQGGGDTGSEKAETPSIPTEEEFTQQIGYDAERSREGPGAGSSYQPPANVSTYGAAGYEMPACSSTTVPAAAGSAIAGAAVTSGSGYQLALHGETGSLNT